VVWWPLNRRPRGGRVPECPLTFTICPRNSQENQRLNVTFTRLS
jgi:hypothetical protein